MYCFTYGLHFAVCFQAVLYFAVRECVFFCFFFFVGTQLMNMYYYLWRGLCRALYATPNPFLLTHSYSLCMTQISYDHTFLRDTVTSERSAT
jgi:hypothetical protein